MNFWRNIFTDYNNVTWEMGALFVAISLCSLIIFQAIDLSLGGRFNALWYGGAISAVLTSYGIYKMGDAQGRTAADNAGEGAPTADLHVPCQPDQRGEAGA